MAITIIKQPSGIYPAYNDSYIIFESSLAFDNKAVISVNPAATFPKVFTIYADSAGKYYFNLKQAARVLFNANGFDDSNFFTSGYHADITGLFKNISLTIEVFNPTLDSESINLNYDFFKGVRQIGDTDIIDEYSILSPSKNGLDYHLTYFEGFTFCFDILKTTIADEIKIKNTNSGIITDAMISTTGDSFRINVDNSNGNNWTSDNVLPLSTGLNKLELYVNDVFKKNIFITKKKQCSGIYLKWLNSSGGFSHYLFNEFYSEQTKGSEIGEVLKSDLLNIYEKTGVFDSMGKNSVKTIGAKVNYNSNEYLLLKEIFSSPKIQMYTSTEENIEGSFIDVKINGSMSHSNKRYENPLLLSIQLPEIQTQIL